MVLSLYEDALGDHRNAETLAWASEYAYLPEPAAKAKYANELGWQAKLISRSNTQAYICTSDEHIVVAFRGTEAPTSIEGLKDWLLTDALNLLMVPEGRLGTDLAAAGVGARFHQGFVTAIDDVWDEVYVAVAAEQKKSERPLWITGHSLGGALALLAGWLFVRRMISVQQIYTFGGPMIGNDLATKAFDREFKGKIFRCVNSPDPVPRLPTMSLIANQYVHCDREIPLGVAGGTVSEIFQQLAHETLQGVRQATLLDDIWKKITSHIAAHGMDHYREGLQAWRKTLS